MHSKFKGNVGQFEAAAYLAKKGYSVFTEQGDISKTDIIAEKDGKLHKIQCKAVVPTNDVVCLELRKCGPKYVYVYTKNDVDIFSIYDITNDKLYWVPSSVLDTHKHSFRLKITKPSNPTQGSHQSQYAEDFLDIDTALEKNAPVT